MSIPRVNFSRLARFSTYCEQRFRQQFSASFDWLGFNTALVKEHCSSRLAIAFDPSFIPKSGKKTDGIGYFWSGCASSVKRGLEICGIAAIDLDNHTAMHLKAIQTIPKPEENALEFYARCLTDNALQLQQTSKVVVADGYFSKKPFVDAISEAGFTLVSRFRDDVALNYILEPKPTGKRGRPKSVGEKVSMDDLSDFETLSDGVYTAIVRAKSLKIAVRVVVVFEPSRKKPIIYFSTDTTMSAANVLEIYRCRFQIEFLYRDAKQHTSLNGCQGRSAAKLDFHFNASLSAVNIAKAKHWLSVPKTQRGEFSMDNIKIMNHNALLIQRFFHLFAINPNTLKNNQNFKELIYFGTNAA